MRELVQSRKFQWLLAALIFAVALLAVSFSRITLPLWVGLPLSLAVIAAVGRRIFWKGIKSLFRLRFSDINLLLTIAAAGALYLRQFEEAVIIVVLFTIGEHLEDFGVQRSQKALKELIEKNPKSASVKGVSHKIPVEEVLKGQIMRILPGETIPLDGKVLAGSSIVDESAITGEPVPKSKFAGDVLYGGTLNGNGYLEAEVLKEVRETTMAKIVELTVQAAQKKSASQRFIEKFSKVYTPLVMAAAILVVAVPVGILRLPFGQWFTQALTLLIIACPCALVISTPVAVFSALGNATKNGVLIKGGKALEALGRLKMVAFDKTKTLTEGDLEVSDIIPFGPFQEEDVLACAAGLERFSEHPIAQSLLRKAQETSLPVHTFKDFESLPGKGVRGQCMVCPDREHVLGSLQFIRERNGMASDKEVLEAVRRLEGQGKTVVLMSQDSRLKGIIAVNDKVREEAPRVLKSIRDMKVQTMMLTGDSAPSARFVAESVGIQNLKAGLLPHQKTEEIKRTQDRVGPVAMVGDGINDAPALAAADVGISLGSAGSDVAIENADIALMRDDLGMLPGLIRLGRKSLRIIRFNILAAILIKFAVLFLAVVGQSNLLLAVFADVGVTIFVILNALRLFAFRPKD